MRYLPHTPDEIKSMLDLIGVQGIDELFTSIPEALRLKENLALPEALSELELRKHLRQLSRKNAHGDEWINFLGAGSYRHYVPSATRLIVTRSEFSTAYTPYQPEVSQGTLQALFEFQTMVAELLGLGIATASHYDGASATAEAILMAVRISRGKRKKALVARSLPPRYREVITTYLRYTDIEVEEIAFENESGRLSRDDLKAKLDENCSCVVVGTPNYFGVLENFEGVADLSHEAGALLVTASPEPWSLALAKSPAEMGADIATAEGQSFGNAMNFGGPSLGLFATHEKYARQVPGRLVGETVDSKGQRGFVLTLATREQHIRRERATSNICTNVSLCALAATISLSLLGPEGFRKIAAENLRKAEQAKQLLSQIPNVSLGFTGPTFNEFAIRVPGDPQDILDQLKAKKILGGLSLHEDYPELENYLIISVTEMNTHEEIANFVRQLGNILAG
jgi:glycine dehydrogenase subunit 1